MFVSKSEYNVHNVLSKFHKGAYELIKGNVDSVLAIHNTIEHLTKNLLNNN